VLFIILGKTLPTIYCILLSLLLTVFRYCLNHEKRLAWAFPLKKSGWACMQACCSYKHAVARRVNIESLSGMKCALSFN
jgi:hypothetical protein